VRTIDQPSSASLLKDDSNFNEITLLEHKWSCARRQRRGTPNNAKSPVFHENLQLQDKVLNNATGDYENCENHWKDYLVAKTVGSILFIVFW
jgi:hypothetical protein